MVLLRYGASFVWGSLLGKAPVSYALQDFLISLFQHPLERFTENLLINRAVGEKNSNSDQDSVQWSICLQFRFKSGWSHNGVLFTVSSTLEHALAVLAQLQNDRIICLHVKVFFYIWAEGNFPNDSLFIVWKKKKKTRPGLTEILDNLYTECFTF